MTEEDPAIAFFGFAFLIQAFTLTIGFVALIEWNEWFQIFYATAVSLWIFGKFWFWRFYCASRAWQISFGLMIFANLAAVLYGTWLVAEGLHRALFSYT